MIETAYKCLSNSIGQTRLAKMLRNEPHLIKHLTDAIEHYHNQFDNPIAVCPICRNKMEGVTIVHFHCKKCDQHFNM